MSTVNFNDCLRFAKTFNDVSGKQGVYLSRDENEPGHFVSTETKDKQFKTKQVFQLIDQCRHKLLPEGNITVPIKDRIELLNNLNEGVRKYSTRVEEVVKRKWWYPVVRFLGYRPCRLKDIDHEKDLIQKQLAQLREVDNLLETDYNASRRVQEYKETIEELEGRIDGIKGIDCIRDLYMGTADIMEALDRTHPWYPEKEEHRREFSYWYSGYREKKNDLIGKLKQEIANRLTVLRPAQLERAETKAAEIRTKIEKIEKELIEVDSEKLLEGLTGGLPPPKELSAEEIRNRFEKLERVKKVTDNLEKRISALRKETDLEHRLLLVSYNRHVHCFFEEHFKKISGIINVYNGLSKEEDDLWSKWLPKEVDSFWIDEVRKAGQYREREEREWEEWKRKSMQPIQYQNSDGRDVGLLLGFEGYCIVEKEQLNRLKPYVLNLLQNDSELIFLRDKVDIIELAGENQAAFVIRDIEKSQEYLETIQWLCKQQLTSKTVVPQYIEGGAAIRHPVMEFEVRDNQMLVKYRILGDENDFDAAMRCIAAWYPDVTK